MSMFSRMLLALAFLGTNFSDSQEGVYAVVDRVEDGVAVIEINQQLVTVDSNFLPGFAVEGTVYELLPSLEQQDARLRAAEQRLQRLQAASQETITL